MAEQVHEQMRRAGCWVIEVKHKEHRGCVVHVGVDQRPDGFYVLFEELPNGEKGPFETLRLAAAEATRVGMHSMLTNTGN
jgi:hypothetical protein